MKKNLINFFTVYLTWHLVALPIALVLGFLKFDLLNDYKVYVYLQTAVEIIILLICSILYGKTLVSDLKKFIKDNDVFQRIIAITVMAFLCEIVGGLIVRSLILILGLPITGSENNELTTTLLKSAPVLMGIGAAVLGPIYEETIMRLGFAKTFKNKKVFFAASGIIFGVMHVVDSIFVVISLPIIFLIIDRITSSTRKNKLLLSSTVIILYLLVVLSMMIIMNHGITNFISSIKVTEALYSIQYIAMGLFLAGVYLKNKNIWYTIVPHMLINTIGVIGLLFI